MKSSVKYYALIPSIFFRKCFDTVAIIQHSCPEIKVILGIPHVGIMAEINAVFCYRGIRELLRTDSLEDFSLDLEVIGRKYSDGTIVFIPTEEDAVDLFLQYTATHGPENFRYFLPSLELFRRLQNKSQLMEMCAEHQIPIPRTLSPLHPEDWADSDFPLIAKPCKGGGGRGVFHLHTRADLQEPLKVAMATEPYVVQKMIGNGKDVEGFFALCKNGEPIGAYTHQRIRTSPPEGGVTVLSRFSKNEEILNSGLKFLRQIKYSGLIMLEFLYDPLEKEYKIIEANPRLWGSVLLSEYGGSNLLSNYVRLCCEYPTVLPTPRDEAYIRWFFPVDLLQYLLRCGKGIRNFWCFRNTCFINWSYANKARALWFNFQALMKIKNFFRFFRR